jgi:hypothetical protein
MNKKPSQDRSADWLLKFFLACVLIAAGTKIVLTNQEIFPTASLAGTQPDSRTVFANCLNRQGAMMYGVDTCEFCLAQKKIFGEDFGQINYINCDFAGALCRQKGITNLPAWEINGKIIYGQQSFEQLSAYSGCKPPTKQ